MSTPFSRPLRSERSSSKSPRVSRQAEALLRAALERNAGHTEALLFAALAAARRGDDDAALPLIASAHALAPHHAEVRCSPVLPEVLSNTNAGARAMGLQALWQRSASPWPRDHQSPPRQVTRDYGAILFRLNRNREALPLLRRAAQMLAGQKHGGGALTSCLLKLSAALLKANQHAECARVARRASRLEPASAATPADALVDACEKAMRAGQDTSSAAIDMAM